MRVNMKAMAKAMDKARLSSVISLERTMDSLSHEINKENTRKHFCYFLWLVCYIARGYILYGAGIGATILAMTIISNNYASPEAVMLPTKPVMTRMPDVISDVATTTIHNMNWGAVGFGFICLAAYTFVNHGFIGNDLYLAYKNGKSYGHMRRTRVIRMSSYVQTHNDDNVRRA